MNSICKDIFKAIHEGKWLAVEYRNKSGSTTKYWIGVKSLNVNKRMLVVDGLHLKALTCAELFIYIDSIISTNIIEGTYQPVNTKLVEDIRDYPEKYSEIFSNTANLKILNYLADCNKLDCTPYKTNYALIGKLDLDVIPPEAAQVLYDHQIDLSGPNVGNHGVQAGPVECSPADAVVHVGLDEPPALFLYIAGQQYPLILDGHAFPDPFIVAGKPAIDTCVIRLRHLSLSSRCAA